MILHQTSEYMISPAVFPTYFIKEKAKAYEMNCQLDIQLFGECIAPELKITDRYVGSEPVCDVTHTYNQCLREQVGQPAAHHRPACGRIRPPGTPFLFESQIGRAHV